MATFPFSAPSRAATPDWETRLIAGGMDEKGITLGLHVKLAKGWKTYWRVPGEAGIPPQIKLDSPEIVAINVLYPLPSRLIDDSGEALGYHDEVVFIVKPTINPALKHGRPQGKLSAFFGVCEKICKPVKFEAELSSAVLDDRLLDKYLEQVPKQGKVATKAEHTAAGLELTLTQGFEDIFVDGPEGVYFRKPVFDGRLARLKIDGLQEGRKLSGEQLRLTASTKGKGLEQAVTVT